MGTAASSRRSSLPGAARSASPHVLSSEPSSAASSRTSGLSSGSTRSAGCPLIPSYGQALSMDSGTEAAARVFGRIEPTRMAFSYDYDLRASWYGKPVRGVLLGRLMTIAGPRFEGRRLRWGYETLEGGIPFLQPAYPRGRGGLATVIRLSSLGDWASTARGPGWRVVARDVIGQLAVLAACVSFALSVIAPMAQGSLQTGVRLLTIVVLGTFILIPIITSEAFVRRLRMHRS